MVATMRICTILILIVTYFLPGVSLAYPEKQSTKPAINTEKAGTTAPIISPKVVVSIPPFHALVSEIMQGVGKPQLLIKSGASSHHAVLSPKDIQSLEQANVIVWGGPDLETFLINPLKNVDNQKTRVVELDTTPKLHWLKTRFSANFSDEEESHDKDHEHPESDEHGSEDSHDDHQHTPGCCGHAHGAQDMHFWLEPNNALVLVDRITAELSQVYPEARTQFEQNAKVLKQNIKTTDSKLKKTLLSVQNKPYLVLHDGYQYFEHHYGLKAVGSITHHPELPLSIARLNKIRDIIVKEKVVCIFSEPGFQSKLIDNLAKEFHLKTGVLNPMERPAIPFEGSNNGTEAVNSGYVGLMEGLANSLKECL